LYKPNKKTKQRKHNFSELILQSLTVIELFIRKTENESDIKSENLNCRYKLYTVFKKIGASLPRGRPARSHYWFCLSVCLPVCLSRTCC